MYKLEKVYDLKEEQAFVASQLLDAIENGAKKIILKGSAGVGKTYLVDYIVETYRNSIRKGTAYITAPTNKAVAVLMNKNPDAEYFLEYSTIHKALYMKRVINDKTGEISFKPDYNPRKEKPFKNGCIIVVDEASMLNSEILYYLEQPDYAHIPMIFLGDNKQLNPVGEKHSPVFARPSLKGQTIQVSIGGELVSHAVPDYIEFELIQIQRQAAGNPIIQLSRDLGKLGHKENNLVPDPNSPDDLIGYEFSSDYQRCIDLVTTEPDTVYLAWTNASVNNMSVAARNKLFNNPNKLELGETIIFSAPYEGFKKDYFNNYVLTINKLEVKSRLFEVVRNFTPIGSDPSKAVNISVDLMYYYLNDDVMVIHESSQHEFYNVLKKLKMLTKEGLSWKVVYGFSEQFAQFMYSYSLTVHKSQGSTYKTVIINMKDMNRNKDFFENPRLWYTGVTRAAKRVILYTPPLYEGS